MAQVCSLGNNNQLVTLKSLTTFGAFLISWSRSLVSALSILHITINTSIKVTVSEKRPEKQLYVRIPTGIDDNDIPITWNHELAITCSWVKKAQSQVMIYCPLHNHISLCTQNPRRLLKMLSLHHYSLNFLKRQVRKSPAQNLDKIQFPWLPRTFKLCFCSAWQWEVPKSYWCRNHDGKIHWSPYLSLWDEDPAGSLSTAPGTLYCGVQWPETLHKAHFPD
jgi:hypothetical protein